MDQNLPSFPSSERLSVPKFVRRTSDIHKCASCHEVPKNPMQTKCGHRLCKSCCVVICKYATEHGPQRCPAGEEDCQYITSESVYRDVSTAKELGQLEVYCVYQDSGCKRIMRWVDLDQHVKACEFATVSCPNEGCTETLPKMSLKEHMNRHCKYNRIRHRIDIEYQDLSLQKECSALSHQPCSHIVKRDLEQRAKTCWNRPLECKYKIIGCKFSVYKVGLQKHYETSLEEHMTLLATQVTSCEEAIATVNSKLKSNQGDETKLKSDLGKGKLKLASLVDILDNETKRAIMVEKLLSSREQSDSELRASVRYLQSQWEECNRRQNQELQTVQKATSYHDRRLSDIERNRDTNDYSSLIEQLGGQVAVLGSQMAEMELRLLCLEVASYSGVLIWKLCDYSRRKRDAVSGRILSLYSQPFFTDRTGYKMCARVYLNGDGVGKDTHMSLFFVVMKGDYDELQQWPFAKNVTLSLLDQCGGTKHLSDTFTADPSSSSFQKPTREANVACGCPLFVAQSLVEGPPYLVNDSIFIQVKVEI